MPSAASDDGPARHRPRTPAALARYDRVKRALDVAAAAAGLAASAPVLAVAAAAIRLESPGPVLFRQERVGRDGARFRVAKLRTMVDGAERKGAGYLVSDGDARITRVGAFLRRTSLDELPQLWNVLVGDMSLIGPRPTLAYQVEQYTPFQRRRLEVRPGVTGWAQVLGRNAISWPRRIELDVWYVDRRSLLLDLEIAVRTALVLVRPEGVVYNDAQGDWGEPATVDDAPAPGAA